MLSVTVPTYCERENIEALLAGLAAVRAELGEPLEVLIIDGHSEDGTAACARGLLDDALPGRVIELTQRLDLASVVVHGFAQARGDLIGVMDADLSHPPALLPELVRTVRAGQEMAVASRYVSGGGVVGWPWRRRALSWLGNLMARPLVSVRDATSGYFVCQAGCVKGLRLRPQGFRILLEILVRGQIRAVQEVPYTFRDRQAGQSKFAWRTGYQYARQLAVLYAHQWRRRSSVRGNLRPSVPK